MTASSKTLGASIGSALGAGAAYAVHGAVRAGQGTGRFGQDLAAGARTGYADKSAELALRREQLRAERQTPVAVNVVRRRSKATA